MQHQIGLVLFQEGGDGGEAVVVGDAEVGRRGDDGDAGIRGVGGGERADDGVAWVRGDVAEGLQGLVFGFER